MEFAFISVVLFVIYIILLTVSISAVELMPLGLNIEIHYRKKFLYSSLILDLESFYKICSVFHFKQFP